MKKLILTVAVLLILAISAISQRIEKPTLASTPCTDIQQALIDTGVQLHDARKFDDAIGKYLQVIEANPGCMVALYELSMTYYAKGDANKAIETALKGSKYISSELPLFYLTLGNALDDLKKYDVAVNLYNDAIKMLEKDKSMRAHLSSLHYNLGLSFRRQLKEKEAREEIKRAIQTNEVYASPHYQLADIFYRGKYKVPAILAAARFISLEFNTDRTRRAAAVITQIMGRTSARKDSDEKIVINLDLGAPTDEGDFGAAELILAMGDALDKTDNAKTKNLTEEEKFAGRIDSLITFLDPKNKQFKGTFSAAQYFPFMLEMKRLGYVKPFAYIVLLQSGNTNALPWLRENETKAAEFIDWSKNYSVAQN